ncbi:MAG: hypothetical protein JWQ87_3042 [Candidatus Sulfotelmatobacter sp.]|nr:hypothetical protein [Candidatus Sulfotelmatobacter sp.]
MTNPRFATSGNVHQTLRNEMHHVQWLEGRERVKIQIYPKRPQKVRRSALDTRIFSCVGNIVGNIAYCRYILLIFQR